MRLLAQAYRASDGAMFDGEDATAVNIMREGFAQAFLRGWELQVELWHGPQAYYCVDNPDTESEERLLPYFEHPDIRILRMVVAVIRGLGGADLYSDCASIYADEIYHYLEDYRVPPYRELLRLQKQHMERFLSAQSESRACRGPGDLGPWDPSNLSPF